MAKAQQIQNPQRIERIVSRICQSSLAVIMRNPDDPATGVRGRAVATIAAGGARGLRISQISDAGIQFLGKAQKIRVEFKGMTSHVLFDGVILQHGSEEVVVSMPQILKSVERRENARFRTSVDHCIFVKSALLAHGAQDFVLHPPVVPLFEDLDGLLMVNDISEGGLCLKSRFPGPGVAAKIGIFEGSASIQFPMEAELPLEIEVRWIKRIKERATIAQGYQRSVLIGVRFIAPGDELIYQIRKFARKASMEQAL